MQDLKCEEFVKSYQITKKRLFSCCRCGDVTTCQVYHMLIQKEHNMPINKTPDTP